MKNKKVYESPEIRITKFSGGEKLTFGKDAEISVILSVDYDERNIAMILNFPDVLRYYMADGYKIEIHNGANKTVKTKKIRSFFRTGVKKKDVYTVRFNGVPVSSEYTIKVYPLDFVGNYGNPLTKTISCT